VVQKSTPVPIEVAPLHWFRRLWVPIVLVLVAMGVSASTISQHSAALSPLDEWVYVDYLYKIPEQPIVLKGEYVGNDALDIMACDGVTPYGPMGPKCGTDYSDHSEFPFGGITSADPYTPLYFYPTWAIGTPLSAVTGVSDVTGWRVAGSLWLPAGLVMMFLLMRRWSVPPLATLGLGLAFIGSPFSYWTYSYVSTDAPAFFFGALLLHIVTRYIEGTMKWWWLPIVSVIAVLVKVTNILAVGLALLVLLVSWIVRMVNRHEGVGEAPTAWRTRIPLVIGASVGAALVAEVAWLAVNRATATDGGAIDQGVSVQLTLKGLLSQLTNFLPNTIVSNVPVVGWDHPVLELPDFVVGPLSWLCIAGVVAAFFQSRASDDRAPLVIAVALGAVLFAPLLALMLQLTTGAYFVLPSRYGAGLLAGILLVTGLTLFQHRWASWVLVAYGAGMCLVVPIQAYRMAVGG